MDTERIIRIAEKIRQKQNEIKELEKELITETANPGKNPGIKTTPPHTPCYIGTTTLTQSPETMPFNTGKGQGRHRGKNWTKTEIKELKEMIHNSENLQGMAQHFNRSRQAIISRLNRLGISANQIHSDTRKNKHWTEAELQTVYQLRDKPVSVIAKEVKRTRAAIGTILWKLNKQTPLTPAPAGVSPIKKLVITSQTKESERRAKKRELASSSERLMDILKDELRKDKE